MEVNLNPEKQPKQGKPASGKKQKASEKRLGYLLVAPSLILILLIAVWPVLQSFYYSLFDLRLNNPTKSEVTLTYHIDLEKYLNSYPFLINVLEDEAGKANGSAAESLNGLVKGLKEVDASIQDDSAVKKQYDQVDDMLTNMEPVSDELSSVKVDKTDAIKLDKTLHKVSAQVKELKGLKNEEDALGLSSSLNEAVIKPNFIGLDHYKENLTDKRMWMAIWNTSAFTLISVFVELVVGLAIALLINKAFFGRGLVRATILIPWAIPTAVSAKMWQFLYDGQNGIVSRIFEKVGLVDNATDLLTSNIGAMFSIIFTDVWKTTPYMALLLLAGLQTISSSLYEAASIDGASKWKQFTTITLPLLKSSILVALLFRTLDAFRVFDLVFVLTGGGPANSTETISILAYKRMFEQTNFGDGSALSVIVFVCVAIISMIFIKFLGRDLLNDR
ncbi:carbohydrate ABC transporter permease [Fictibacillus terranigra]|uniref:Sugar ABC transporter permease n=1 Tax=Fictibacillus terranigra TaxID=3058424 RepID=A0ABT8EC32_9BACL|nr:sugar ABC transporter permease [Fictibacillus sp. CENA-BCM004]MDN4075476.1 sugar ABC transporter permease [Fictibacillus sp. CENA-BCM004]